VTPRSELVSNAALRARFLELRDRDGLTYAELARRAGWLTCDGSPDRARVMRILGLERPRQTTSPANAAVLADALGMAPSEAGV